MHVPGQHLLFDLGEGVQLVHGLTRFGVFEGPVGETLGTPVPQATCEYITLVSHNSLFRFCLNFSFH